jgi:hypothetical protein
MRLSSSEADNLVQRFIRRVNQGKDESLFSLLLLLERERHADSGSAAEIPIGKAKAVARLNQRWPIIASLSRYVE